MCVSSLFMIPHVQGFVKGEEDFFHFLFFLLKKSRKVEGVAGKNMPILKKCAIIDLSTQKPPEGGLDSFGGMQHGM